MFTYNYTMQVRYSDTDEMGYNVYNANYGHYFEQARAEAMRSLGINQTTLQQQGITLPVTRMNVKFIQPAFVDEMLTIKTTIPYMPCRSMIFQYEIYNEKGELLNKAETQMTFGNVNTNTLINAPGLLVEKLQPFFEDQVSHLLPLINDNTLLASDLPVHAWEYKKAG